MNAATNVRNAAPVAAPVTTSMAAPVTAPAKPSFFERLFGKKNTPQLTSVGGRKSRKNRKNRKDRKASRKDRK